MRAGQVMLVDIKRTGDAAGPPSRAAPSTDAHVFLGLEGPLAAPRRRSRRGVPPPPPRSRRTGASDPRARAATPGLPQQLIPRAAAGTAAGDAARRTDARHATASDDPVGRQSAARMSPATVATAAVRPAPPMRHARGAAALRAACREVAPAT